MEAKVIKEFQKAGRKRVFKVGDVLPVYERGIYADGEWICDDDSPFAKEFLKLLKNNAGKMKVKEGVIAVKELSDLEKTLNSMYGTEGLNIEEFVEHLARANENSMYFLKKEFKDLLETLSRVL